MALINGLPFAYLFDLANLTKMHLSRHLGNQTKSGVSDLCALAILPGCSYLFPRMPVDTRPGDAIPAVGLPRYRP